MNGELPAREIVLDFEDVAFNSGKPGFDLTLFAGELALVETGEKARAGGLGDVALGLVNPVRGAVRFRGMAWRAMAPAEAEHYRRAVGRVWPLGEGAAWLQNLDVDENIQLAQRCDPAQGVREVGRRAAEVAERFGMSDLPRMRPAVAGLRTLQVAQWVRAFLPKDLALLILDRPLQGAEEKDAALLVKNVAEARERGTAVLWLEAGAAGFGERRLDPTWHFQELPASLRPEA